MKAQIQRLNNLEQDVKTLGEANEAKDKENKILKTKIGELETIIGRKGTEMDELRKRLDAIEKRKPSEEFHNSPKRNKT